MDQPRVSVKDSDGEEGDEVLDVLDSLVSQWYPNTERMFLVARKTRDFVFGA